MRDRNFCLKVPWKISGGRSLRLKWPESPPWSSGTKFRPRTSGLVPPLICRFTGMTNCGQAGVSVLVRTGVSAPRAGTKFRPTSSGGVPPLNCALALEVNIWWGRSLRLESPRGRSLRRARSKAAPNQMFRGTSARCLHEYEFSSDKVAGDSALVSPKIPESPPLQE